MYIYICVCVCILLYNKPSTIKKRTKIAGLTTTKDVLLTL